MHNSDWTVTDVVVGDHDVNSAIDCDTDDPTQCSAATVTHEIATIISHEGYKNGIHDIALLRLKKQVKFNTYVKPICLPLKPSMWTKDYSGHSFSISGWGK